MVYRDNLKTFQYIPSRIYMGIYQVIHQFDLKLEGKKWQIPAKYLVYHRKLKIYPGINA